MFTEREPIDFTQLIKLSRLENVNLNTFNILAEDIKADNAERISELLPQGIRFDFNHINRISERIFGVEGKAFSDKALHYSAILASSNLSETTKLNWWNLHTSYLEDSMVMLEDIQFEPIDLTEEAEDMFPSDEYIDYVDKHYEQISKDYPVDDYIEFGAAYTEAADFTPGYPGLADSLLKTGVLYACLTVLNPASSLEVEKDKLLARINNLFEDVLLMNLKEINDDFDKLI